LTLAAKVKGAGSLRAGIGLDALMEFDRMVALGNEFFSVEAFVTLIRRGRGIVRRKDGFLSLDPPEILSFLEAPSNRTGLRSCQPAGYRWIWNNAINGFCRP